MGRSQAQFLTDFSRLHAHVLPHEEHPRGARRQPREAGFQRPQELRLVERAIGVLPRLGMLVPVPALVEEPVEVGGAALLVALVQRPPAALPPDRVDDLVLQDPGDPGAQVRAPFEAALRRERGEQRLLPRPPPRPDCEAARRRSAAGRRALLLPRPGSRQPRAPSIGRQVGELGDAVGAREDTLGSLQALGITRRRRGHDWLLGLF